MKAVIAIDSFKGSLTSLQAGEAVSRALKQVYPNATARVIPLADGGEGTVKALVATTNGRTVSATVTGPLGKPVTAEYGILPHTNTAVIEMAAAAGLPLLTKEERNPLHTTTRGVGELILHAIETHGCRHFVLGIGGSATNDGGAGMLSALGFEFLDADGNPIADGAAGLASLASIRTEHVDPALAACQFDVACDVKNPLCGENGCSAVFGPQKGASPETVQKMDAWLSAFADKTAAIFPHADKDAEGAGAAGGMGFALMSYLGAKLQGGIDLVLCAAHFDEAVRDADMVITGEGRLDAQSMMGKAPLGVARAAAKYGKPVIALCGSVAPHADLCHRHGIHAFFPILHAPCTLEEAMQTDTATKNIERTAEEIFRLIAALSYPQGKG